MKTLVELSQENCIPSGESFQSIGPLGRCFLKVKMSVCLSVCVFFCLFTFEVPCNGLFDPTSRSRMSNIFRDLESLGKSNGKKWSNV